MVIIDRKEVRYAAKEYEARDLMKSTLVVFLFYLIVSLFFAGSFALALTGKLVLAIVGAVIGIASIFVVSGLTAGYYSYFMNIHTYGSGDVSDLFTNFSLWWGMFKVQLLTSLKVFLWSIIPIAGPILGFIASLRYAMAPFVYIDDDSKSARECINESKLMMKGYKADYFILMLSLILWGCLCSLFLQVLLSASMIVPMLGNSDLMSIIQMNGGHIALEGEAAVAFFKSLPLLWTILFVVFNSLVYFVVLSPLMAYMSMIRVEFYQTLMQGDNYAPLSRVNTDQTVGEKAILILTTAVLSVALAAGGFFSFGKVSNGIVKGLEAAGLANPPVVEPVEEPVVEEEPEEPEINEADVDKSVAELAKKYLEEGFYSRSELIKYLVQFGDNVSEDTATTAVDSLKVDWNEQALHMAQEYIDNNQGISEEYLKSYLTLDEYTSEEIDYAMKNVKVDWQEQAIKRAKYYHETQPDLSKEELISSLVFESYPEADAKKAVNEVFK